ncbi:alpha-hydroxy acid oxidase [Actinopolymorpha pittospori]|uniref:4-hydroxymandelate oxidase n=1 Tax=Actinopolymorpha pittospori TaxID=648752 RepID=A0A927N9Y4_9ACTN|nr:alpha-hydroxy acid oxidase [Actinopolymorpha pittospori]MBE1611020.1 4-hydroxymandelate oxidase [Actinopolymorpha pittospori]
MTNLGSLGPTGPARLEAAARSAMSGHVYDYIATGSGVEETLAANEAAWRDLLLRPRVLRDVTTVDTSTTVLGTPVSAPVLVAPTGYQRLVHPEGEVGMAAGSARAGSLLTLSTRATVTFEELVEVSGPWWLQLYILRDRGLTETIVQRAAAAGARALVLTVDTPYVARKARRTPFPPDVVSPVLVPELQARDDKGVWQDPGVTVADLAWLAEISGLPLVVKGVLRGDEARACVDAGAAAIWVSNHGGRQLDGVVPTATALAEVRAAVPEEVEVYVDGGLRTGRDVLRALALGATATFVGRPAVWALATEGAAGVHDLLVSLRAELEEAMALAGCRTVAEVAPDLLHP